MPDPIDAKELPTCIEARGQRWLIDLWRAVERTDDGDLTVDFSAVHRISSYEINELVRLYLRLRHRDRRLVIERVQKPIFTVFEITRLDRLVEVRELEIPAA